MELQEFRLERLRTAAAAAGLGTVVASSPTNISYLSGGYRSIAQEVSATTQLYALLDCVSGRVRYVASVAEIPSLLEHAGLEAEIYCYGPFQFQYCPNDRLAGRVEALARRRFSTGEQALAAAIGAGAQPAGLDEGHVCFPVYQRLCEELGGPLRACREVFMQARRVKHREEISNLRTAAQIAQAALKQALAAFRPGMTEIDLQECYRAAVTQAGAVPYFFVATAAKRSAFVDTTNRAVPIPQGAVIRFDFGCIWNGFYSDLARTAVAGRADAKTAAVYRAVAEGCRQAIAAIRPGITAGEIFEFARRGTQACGIADYRRSHCGHGIGLEGYDLPSVAREESSVLEENMVLCIETPYYRVGWGGVQVEDTVVVTRDGCEFLDSGDMRLIELEI